MRSDTDSRVMAVGVACGRSPEGLATRRARGNGLRRLVQGILATPALAVDGEANDLGLTARRALAVAYRLSVLASAADDDADVVLIQPRPVCNLRS